MGTRRSFGKTVEKDEGERTGKMELPKISKGAKGGLLPTGGLLEKKGRLGEKRGGCGVLGSHSKGELSGEDSRNEMEGVLWAKAEVFRGKLPKDSRKYLC